METWEHKFWKIVEEKGIGANVDFPLALRDLFIATLKLERESNEMSNAIQNSKVH